ncbi:MAG TPA: hypothetical protein VE755_08755 [Myxococcales bacterium]|jgi:hypothetical protein|nr:hypothetical protein [Myxococcales bacterium]
MKTVLSIAFVALLSACAAAPPRPQADQALHRQWQGYVVRDGVREPVTIEVTEPAAEENGTSWTPYPLGP